MKQGRKPLDLSGQRFGKLLAHERVGTQISPKSALWRCTCDCGAEVVIGADSLRSLREPACEACAVPRSTGATSDSAYGCWNAMIARCESPTANGYAYYGGRGIRVCGRWRASFFDFLADAGPRPSASHTLDRIDGDGHYEPGNVRWATMKEQAQNRRPRGPNRVVA